jgi:outer membrane protein OmpA-like peptidoglycan-associated protein
MTRFSRQVEHAMAGARTVLFAIPLLGMLAGCGTPPGASPVADKQELETALQGTPAALTIQADNSLGVHIPLRSCFDRGRATVKPPLAKVLDRMAARQRHETTHLLVTAPADPGGKALALAMQRAVTTRDYLIERGLDASRFSVSAVPRDPMVKIVIMASASP